MRGMSSGLTRKMAVSIQGKADRGAGAQQGHGLEPDIEGPGLRDWFHGMPKSGKGHFAAAFDTRGDYGPMVGGAAPGVAHRLQRHGYHLVLEPQGFIIEGTPVSYVPGVRTRPRLGRRNSPAGRRASGHGPADDHGIRAGAAVPQLVQTGPARRACCPPPVRTLVELSPVSATSMR